MKLRQNNSKFDYGLFRGRGIWESYIWSNIFIRKGASWFYSKSFSWKIGNELIEKHEILCGDPSHFQGDEKDIIFLSMIDSNKNSDIPLKLKSEGKENENKKDIMLLQAVLETNYG